MGRKAINAPAGFIERWRTLSVSAELKRLIETTAQTVDMSQNELVDYAVRRVVRIEERKREWREARRAPQKVKGNG